MTIPSAGVPIAILASGRGTNFEAILSAVREGTLAADIACVISDQPDAPVLSKARAAGIPALAIPPPARPRAEGLAGAIVEKLQHAAAVVTHSDAEARAREERRVAHEREILRQLEPYQPKFLVLAGYMRIMTPLLLDRFLSERGYRRIVNIHPSLLPAFPGVDAYRQAFEAGAKTTGVTVHLVDHGVDTGPICAQEAFSIEDCTSVEEISARGFPIEHRLYPETLAWVLHENFRFEKTAERSRCVREN